MDALSYRLSSIMKGKAMPKKAGIRALPNGPKPLFTGRPTESVEDPTSPLQGGLAGAINQPIPATPFSSLFLFKRRT